MSESSTIPPAPEAQPTPAASRADRRLWRRYAFERSFQVCGIAAISFAIGALFLLLGTVVYQGASAFTESVVKLPVELDPASVDPMADGSPESLAAGDFSRPVRAALRTEFPEVSGRRDKRSLSALLSVGAEYDVAAYVQANPASVGSTREFALLLSDDADLYIKGRVDRSVDEADRKISDQQIAWLDTLVERGQVVRQWNTRLLTSGDSREPELAGIQGAMRGSFLTLLVTLVLSFPVGVAAAIYLEEFAPRNRLTDIVEVNINNLAAVPSIVFGLLGLAAFLNLFGMPRSAPLVGGIVLALMTLPTVIIASRAALSAVPPSVREAALGVGASAMQAVLHHVLPQALPGILTGTIIGMARALGETAPLLMIGMVAFIVDLPQGPTDPATVLPVQIFLWSDAPERAFADRMGAAIIVLLGFLIIMNAAAVTLRRRYETKY